MKRNYIYYIVFTVVIFFVNIPITYGNSYGTVAAYPFSNIEQSPCIKYDSSGYPLSVVWIEDDPPKTIDLNEFILGVVEGEMGSGKGSDKYPDGISVFHLESLKAQAVAIRSYVLSPDNCFRKLNGVYGPTPTFVRRTAE